MVSLWSLSNSNHPQVFRSLLSALTDLNNAEVWMDSTRPLLSKSSNPCANPLMTVPCAPVITGITVTFMLHSFFCTLAMSKYLILFSLSFNFVLWSAGTADSTIRPVLFFVLVVWPRLDDHLNLNELLLLLLLQLLLWEIFTSADGFSLESEWQQVSQSLQDSSQYSGRSQ